MEQKTNNYCELSYTAFYTTYCISLFCRWGHKSVQNDFWKVYQVVYNAEGRKTGRLLLM